MSLIRIPAGARPDVSPGAATGARRALLLVLSGNMLLDALEVSTVVVAMPTVGAELHLSPWTASWLMTAFALGFGGSILLGARVAARFGRRRVYLAAMFVFAIASAVSAGAGAWPLLLASRAVKGACVALTAPTGLSIIASRFPAGPDRQRAVSAYTLAGAVGFSAGLVLSGLLTLLDWRCTPVLSGLVALVLLGFGVRYIPGAPETAPPTGPEQTGPAAPIRWGPVTRSALGAAALNGPYWGFLFVVTYRLQVDRGWSPLLTGLALLPASVPLAVAAPFGSRLLRRMDPARSILVGSVLACAGYVWYAVDPDHPGYLTRLLPVTLLVGAAFVLCFSALHLQAVRDVTPARQSTVGGVYQTSVQIGGAAALVAVAAVVARAHDAQAAPVLVASLAAAGALVAATGVVADHRRRSPNP